jgi:hypothetical protein
MIIVKAMKAHIKTTAYNLLSTFTVFTFYRVKVVKVTPIALSNLLNHAFTQGVNIERLDWGL